MKISGYQKNNCNNKFHNNIYYSNKNHFCNNNFHSPIDSLLEVENFLCNLKIVTKCINLYKFFK